MFGQEKQLIACMTNIENGMSIVEVKDVQDHQATIDGEQMVAENILNDSNTCGVIDDTSPVAEIDSSQVGFNQNVVNMDIEKEIKTKEVKDGLFHTPEAYLSQLSDCHFGGNKFYQLLSEESNHSKWEEFRRRAQSENMNDECTNLLRRMELEDSESEEESQSGILTEEVTISLEELINDTGRQISDGNQEDYNGKEGHKTWGLENLNEEGGNLQAKKRQKRQWGPTIRVDRPRRVP